MHYFKMVMPEERRWTLAIERSFPDGTPIDIWAYSFCESQPVDRPVPFYVDAAGETKDFNPTAFGTIVVSKRMADIFSRFAASEIQRIPAEVKGAQGNWEVLNVLAIVDCIDHERSKIQYYPDDHPEKPGKPRGVLELVINPDKALGHHVFKPKDWLVSMLVSEVVKAALTDFGITGVEFWPVA